MNSRTRRNPDPPAGRAVVLAALACILGASAGAGIAQQGGSKQAEKFLSKSEETRKAIEQTRGQIQETMELYHSIIGGEAKKPASVYKKLSGAVDQCDKMASGIGKKVEAMNKEGEKFFQAWEKELEGYSSESFRSRVQERLDHARGRFDKMNERMVEAGEIYDPFITSLRDQVLFLGRDLGPDAVALLQGEAEKLSGTADELFAKIDQILHQEEEDEGQVTAIAQEEDEAAVEREADAEMGGDADPDDGP